MKEVGLKLLGFATFFALGFAVCTSLQPTPSTTRAYCLEAPAQEPYTVHVSGPPSTILALTDREYGRYVVSEGECKKEE